ncbi:MAG: twin-arginine translocation signal domain-containing protein [Kiritimatiellaeota bacterium]|nr:twin-arginine translocation signal domain-containing protein [Kiritimatiellota bacterium]
MHRREFLKRAGMLGAAVASGGLAGAVHGGERAGALPTIRLGDLEVSRLLLGSNPFFGFAHKPGDIGRRMTEYYTDEKIMADLDRAAAQGITAVVGPPFERWQKLFKTYLDRDGKLRIWISQPDRSPEKIPAEIEESVKAGAKAVYIQGHRVEQMYEKNTFEVVRGWVELIRKLGVPAGIGAHRTDCHLEAQKRNFPVDFYFQCMFNVAHGDSFEQGDPQKAAEVIRQLKKPVVAYKILGAGRVPPRQGFEFAFRNIRPKDGVCVGVFTKDNPDQIKENADLAKECSALSR